MQLKNYQIATLEVLQRFFEASRIYGHEDAYKRITSEPEIANCLGKLKDNYIKLASIPYTPRICLKVPTGGGKTIIASHALKIASETWLEKEFPLVLWFTPTDTIRQQTSEALKNPRHPYREVLDEQFKGKVRIFDIDEKFNIRPQDISQNLCIVVSTIQSFTKKDTTKYNAYKHNENLEPHFSHISFKEGMEKDENGKLKFSFANLLHHHQPIMIVDEAHNALTALTEEAQRRISPSAIIELTATPRLQNNTLYNVRATELKEEEMIKLPIALTEHYAWELAVTEAIAKRAELEKASSHEREYIRPILLFQAQNVNDDVNVEVLKNYLIENMNLPESEIAIATGDQKELDGINIFDRNCPIKYIITVQALKEGWDCSFAYVLCSLANVKSNTAVEQLLGRVMRMPYAKTRKISSLNKAYAYVVSKNFGEAANALTDKLIAKGFDDEEAKSVIEQQAPDFGLFGCKEHNKIILDTLLTKNDIPETFELKEEASGFKSLVITNKTTEEDLEKVCLKLSEKEVFALKTKFNNYKKIDLEPSFAKQGEVFKIPRLMAYIQGELALAEPDYIFENYLWSINELANHKLEPVDFKIEKQGNGFVIDLDNQSLKYSIAGENEPVFAFGDVENWTENNLISWLEKTIRQKDITQAEMLKWLLKVVSYLTNDRGLKVSELMVAKFVLSRKLEDRISKAGEKAKNEAFQNTLFAETAKTELDFDNGFEFSENMYDDEMFYRGKYKFSKHYLGSNKVPAFDGNENGEEFDCAKAIDSLSDVKFWLRNVAKNKKSFWLPTSSDKFYPDFIAMLNDGRILVVEYKGNHIVDNADTKEKSLIGELWEKQSGGKGLFMIAEKSKDGLNTKEQIEVKISKGR